MDYFERFASNPAISYINVVLAVAVQQGWVLQHWNVKEAFVNGELDVEMYIKLSDGSRQKSDKAVNLERALYEVKQTG